MRPNKKQMVLNKLVEYFIREGEILSYKEYASRKDTPVRPIIVKRTIGPWSRVLAFIKKYYKEEYELLMSEGSIDSEPEDDDDEEELEDPNDE